LIELLIVVAIIAILAAIAVPNFLEAQVRAKISRLKADMRSAATAIEAYAVDERRVPLGNVERIARKLPADWGTIWAQLTTPIAYMTSPIVNPFTTQGGVGSKGAALAGNVPPDYQSVPGDAATSMKSFPPYAGAARNGYSWFFEGIGPSRRLHPTGMRAVRGLEATLPNSIDVFYDPSNGTVSLGFIVRSNKQQH